MDKLNKAKDRRLVGDRMLDGKREKQIEDMTSAHIKTIPKNNKFISADSF